MEKAELQIEHERSTIDTQRRVTAALDRLEAELARERERAEAGAGERGDLDGPYTRAFRGRTLRRKHPHLENVMRDARSSKDEPK